MPEGKVPDLYELLGDSLSLQCNIAAPARFMSSAAKPDCYYERFVRQDPYKILGEVEFEKQKDPVTNTPIQEFYAGANVFITGATGFVGKLLFEKLIRSVPHIGHIYLLIRAKKGKTPTERFEQLLDDKVFRRMKAEVPDYARKLTVIKGDIGTPGLGLSPEDRRTLTDNVNIVFHSAADVRFIEPLRVAVESNVLGSRRVLELAKEMNNLWSYVHVSTAFSHCVRREIDETVPRLNIHYREILNYIESKTDEELKQEETRLMQGWPNTYTFSKAVCEEMLNEEARDLPACIFRPSVVTPTYREPVRGYTDNMYGPVGMVAGAGHGVLHCFSMCPELGVDTVPVDYVVNCMVAVAWRTANDKHRSNDAITVYNFTFTSNAPGISWKTANGFYLMLADFVPFSRSMWYPSFFGTENDYVFELCWYLLHKIPGAFVDKYMELNGRTPRLGKIYKRIESLKEHVDYFSFRNWIFKNDNVKELWRTMSQNDRELFYFDVRDVDLKEYFLLSKLGLRYYFLKESMESIPAAQRKSRWLYWIHNSLKLTCSVLALKLLVVTANALPF